LKNIVFSIFIDYMSFPQDNSSIYTRPTIKKDYPCSRDCVYIQKTKNRPWVTCDCNKKVIKN